MHIAIAWEFFIYTYLRLYPNELRMRNWTCYSNCTWNLNTACYSIEYVEGFNNVDSSLIDLFSIICKQKEIEEKQWEKFTLIQTYPIKNIGNIMSIIGDLCTIEVESCFYQDVTIFTILKG